MRARVAADKSTFASGLARYAESDLTCYRATGPRELASVQEMAWDALLGWARRRYDIDFAITQGVTHVPQPAGTVEQLSHAVEAWSRRALAAPTLAWALMAEPVDPALEVERSESKRAYRDVFADLLDEGVRRHELAPIDSRLAAASIVGAMQEALVGPLAQPVDNAEALVASLIAFVLNAVQAKESSAWPSRRTRRMRPTRS